MAYRKYKRKSLIKKVYEKARYGPAWQLGLLFMILAFMGGLIGTSVIIVAETIGVHMVPAKQAQWLLLTVGLVLLPFFVGLLIRSRETQRGAGLLAGFRSGRNMESIGWHDFERLCAGVLREMGYRVVHKGGSGGDGGIDLIAEGKGERYLVQAKHWKSKKVGVAVIREMVGAALHHGFDRVMVITSGNFTHEAIEFAKGKQIVLIDGNRMRTLVSTF